MGRPRGVGVDGGSGGVGASKAERSIGGAGGAGTDTSSGDIVDAISSAGMSICSTKSAASCSFELVAAAEGCEGDTGVGSDDGVMGSSKEV